jgi:hypothetical protein
MSPGQKRSAAETRAVADAAVSVTSQIRPVTKREWGTPMAAEGWGILTMVDPDTPETSRPMSVLPPAVGLAMTSCRDIRPQLSRIAWES